MLRCGVLLTISVASFIVSGCATQTGFFGGMHILPYSRNIAPGRIYTTISDTGGAPKFGVKIAEFCQDDADAIRNKYGRKLALSSSYTADTANFTTSNTANLGITGVTLKRADIGGSAKVVQSQTYKFNDVITKSVTLEGAELVRQHIGANCKSIIRRYKNKGRFVFVTLEVIVPKKATVDTKFNPTASLTAKIQVTKNVKPGITGSFQRSQNSVVSSKDVAVEVIAIEL